MLDTTFNWSTKSGTINENDLKKIRSLLIQPYNMKPNKCFFYQDSSGHRCFTSCYGRYGNYIVLNFYLATEQFLVSIEYTSGNYTIR